MVKRTLEQEPMGSRRRERPSIRRLDGVCNNMKAKNVRNWKELMFNWKAWNRFFRKPIPQRIVKLIKEEVVVEAVGWYRITFTENSVHVT